MYKCKYFGPKELVPPEIAQQYIGREDEIYGLFDENLLKTIDLVREWSKVGLTINNWSWGGARRNSGLRSQNSSVGAPKSAHKIGKAVDIVSPKITTKQLWELIDKNQSLLPTKIRIEKTSGGKPITWLHIDTNAASTQNVKVYYFNA
jgi:hypothetical protein